MKNTKIIASENVAVFPTFKCDEGELAILTAMIAVCDKTKPAESITGGFKSSPWFFSIEVENEDPANDEAFLSIRTGTMIPICDIVGRKYWDSLDDDQRVAVGPCVLKMIEENLLKAEFALSEYDDSVSPEKPQKVARNK